MPRLQRSPVPARHCVGWGELTGLLTAERLLGFSGAGGTPAHIGLNLQPPLAWLHGLPLAGFTRVSVGSGWCGAGVDWAAMGWADAPQQARGGVGSHTAACLWHSTGSTPVITGHPSCHKHPGCLPSPACASCHLLARQARVPLGVAMPVLWGCAQPPAAPGRVVTPAQG